MMTNVMTEKEEFKLLREVMARYEQGIKKNKIKTAKTFKKKFFNFLEEAFDFNYWWINGNTSFTTIWQAAGFTVNAISKGNNNQYFIVCDNAKPKAKNMADADISFNMTVLLSLFFHKHGYL